jgi:hypothetical protein
MIKKASILLILIFAYQAGKTQGSNLNAIFDNYLKSVVKVEVTNIPGKDDNVCTGFIWKDTRHIVTSLHAMSTAPEAKIWVTYLDKYTRPAKVVRVLVKADLVLLEITPDKNGNISIPDGVQSLTAYNSQPIPIDNKIYALGYNHGAPKSSSRSLVKAYTAPPENLASLPEDDQEKIKNVGFPELTLEIIHADGNLLPGYSGSPIFDANGKLVGIGDGGLKKGQASVSWCIPAKFLAELENSSITRLPDKLSSSDQHFSSSVPRRSGDQSENSGELALNEETYEENTSEEYEYEETDSETGEEMDDYYYEEGYEGYESTYYEDDFSIVSEDFEFWWTQSASIVEMAETAANPGQMYGFSNELASYNVTLDYENLRFDIYEDINYGVILAVPEGDEIYYDENSGIFQVNYDENPDIDLFFMGYADVYSLADLDSEISEVFSWLPAEMAKYWNVGGFTINEAYSSFNETEDGRKIAYILMASEQVEYEPGRFSTINLYVAILMSPEKTFISVASYKLEHDYFEIAKDYGGVDCINWSGNPELCDYFESLFKVFCAAHLTTFAY